MRRRRVPRESEERQVEYVEVEEGPPRRPPPFESPWVAIALLTLLVVGGLLVWLLAFRDDDDTATTTTTAPVTTVQTVTDPTLTETETSTTVQTVTTTTEVQPAAGTIPDLTRLQYAEAMSKAAAADVAVDSYPVESDEQQGLVVAQNPDPGASADLDRPMRINVALGPDPPGSATVPDVTGPMADEARTRLVDANLTVRTVFREAPEPDNVGEVILQEPSAGAEVSQLDQVTIYVGR